MTDLTVAGSSKVSYWGTNTSDMQSSVTVADGAITGTLKYLSSGSLVDVWGAGNFIALAFSNFSSGLTYDDVQVGLIPTMGAGMQTLDSDCDGVFKITDKNQKLKVVQKGADGQRVQFFDLSGLTLETEA